MGCVGCKELRGERGGIGICVYWVRYCVLRLMCRAFFSGRV